MTTPALSIRLTPEPDIAIAPLLPPYPSIMARLEVYLLNWYNRGVWVRGAGTEFFEDTKDVREDAGWRSGGIALRCL